MSIILKCALLGEVILAGYDGKRIISTQLVARLGVTRSAVSQMVNKLEARGIVRRVPTK
ncbi:MAG: MarR family transcriptional regulator [Christensenellaceae bacterium]